ncbi:MAG: hypothetical protein WBI83_02990 [bacterium]|jgi:hypothetical protein|nr:hypothetical protein [Bacillota bacterium]HHW55849.1 hypothetical protein [Bacillota bacterium]
MLWKEIAGVSVTAVIIGLVELAKRAGLNPRYGGHLAWFLGLVIVMGYGILAETGHNLVELFLIGSALGLSAAGLYSVGRVHYQNYQRKKRG